MKLLLTINDKPIPKNPDIPKREASRAILFDKRGLIPILFVSSLNYHKLPGGGIEEGENKMEALAREILEETGCTAEIKGEVGKILEYRSKWNLLQTSFCYYGEVLSKGPPVFTEEEAGEGFIVEWTTLDNAIEKIKNDKPFDYEGGFIKKRDLNFLETFKKLKVADLP